MAGTTTSSPQTAVRGSELAQLVIEHNKLVTDLEVLRAGLAALASSFGSVCTKLDADAGVTDTNYNALFGVTVTSYDGASDMTAAKIGDRSGTVIS